MSSYFAHNRNQFKMIILVSRALATIDFLMMITHQRISNYVIVKNNYIESNNALSL